MILQYGDSVFKALDVLLLLATALLCRFSVVGRKGRKRERCQSRKPLPNHYLRTNLFFSNRSSRFFDASSIICGVRLFEEAVITTFCGCRDS